MGSITSRPKAPAVVTQNTTYIPPTQTPNTSTTTVTEPTQPVEPNPEEISKTRVENILRRSRGALGTVFTSFRGVLSSNNLAPQRKSLLGE